MLIPIVGLILGIVATVLGAVAKRDIAARRPRDGGTVSARSVSSAIVFIAVVASSAS